MFLAPIAAPWGREQGNVPPTEHKVCKAERMKIECTGRNNFKFSLKFSQLLLKFS